MSKTVKLILCLIIPIIGFIFYIKDHYFHTGYVEENVEVNFEPFFSSQPATVSRIIAFLIIVRTGHRKAESTARRKDSNRGMF
ncbi:hypothetical protein OZD66_05225, partial [Wolbachia endosymbiont of Drosophila baimaii]|nr:hypothetical protein [Wolbachia endosymbiont of Drosophila baimaii]